MGDTVNVSRETCEVCGGIDPDCANCELLAEARWRREQYEMVCRNCQYEQGHHRLGTCPE